MKKLSILLLFIPIFLGARPLSKEARISLMTCAPGNELYSAFGHSAIRVKDPKQGLDIVYGYGTFDFSDPLFLPKFIKRDLMYFLDTDKYGEFQYVYKYFKRSFDEQILDLDSIQTQRIYDFLKNNMKAENRFYLYDFFFDNCATRIRDVLYNELGPELKIEGKDEEGELTFRDILDLYLQESHWMDFGIDLALGAVVDKKATPWEQTFHPDYLAAFFQDAKLGGKHLVESKSRIYDAPPAVKTTSFFIRPLFLVSL
ncbi:MAG: DUF4105 domain-containing protein, partial [Bacteroidota bacterium]